MATLSEALGIALDLHGAGRLDEAGELYGRILDAAPDHAQTLYLAGTLKCQQDRFAEARPLLERAAALAPDLYGAHLNLGKVHARAGDWAAAARACRRALALAPADMAGWELLSMSARQGEERQDAVAALTRAHRIAPQDAGIAGKLGLLLFERGREHLEERRARQGLADLAMAARLLPFDMDLGFALGTARAEAGSHAEAVAVYRRVLAWSPAEAQVLHNKGVALMRAGQADAAARILMRAVAVAPEESDPCEALAALLNERDRAQAVHWSTRALAIKLSRVPAAPGESVPAAPEGGRTLDVVSFSLWGRLEAYCGGAIDNARRFPEALPGWRCRFYHDDTVPPHILAELASLGAELVPMPSESTARQGMFWRFLASDDPTVRRFLCRDSDSRPTAREIAALREWIGSGVPFHAMRDHVMHMEPLMGGMWGGTAGVLPPMGPEVDRFTASRTGRWNDQHFLAEWVWPRVANRILVHDGVHAALGRAFPETPDAAGEDHVGAKLFHLTRLPPAEGRGERLEAEGRHGRLAYLAQAPHIGRSLECLGEWLEVELALCAVFLSAGDAVIDADAGIGAHALAFSRMVGAGGRVFADEGAPGLAECLARTVAANGLANVAIGAAPDAELSRLRLVRAAVRPAGDPLEGRLAGIVARERPILYLRIEDDAAAAAPFARLMDLGYRLHWHIAPVFNPGNRRGCFTNPFPGLVSVNALALPPGHPPPPRRLAEIGRPEASWREAAWGLTCDG